MGIRLNYIIDPSGCWTFQGVKNGQGYGTIWSGDNRRQLAHRVAYRGAVGPIPPGMCVLHTCDNPSCVRPDHLRLGTKYDNNHDAIAKGRNAKCERNGAARLNSRQVSVIRKAYGPGVTMRFLAGCFGVGVTAIHGVIHHVTWR